MRNARQVSRTVSSCTSTPATRRSNGVPSTTFADELTELKRTYGLNHAACSDTMKATREDVISEVDEAVPAMVRLMERQEQGWAYIKP